MKRCAIVVGASHAGSQLALSLRQQGWKDDILLIGEEPTLPYHRPPLSKDYLTGKKSIDDILIRQEAFYKDHGITLKLEATVKGIDRKQKVIRVSCQHDLMDIPYDKLALCTGARVRNLTLPGTNLKRVHYLRTLHDIEKLMPSVSTPCRGIVIGGGYIGLETAAMLSELGHRITILEVAPQLLGRVASPELGEFYTKLHREHGVEIRTGVGIQKILGQEYSEGVELSDGTRLACDFVVIGIGVIPNDELAAEAGLVTDNGIVVDECAQTSDPNIVAAGDCTRFQHEIYGNVRLESVPNATEQAKVAASTLCGKLQQHNSLPWFWSKQYDCKLQIAGLSQGYDKVIIRGSTEIANGEVPSFCIFYFKADKLIAADCLNRHKEFMLSKYWLQTGQSPNIEKLSNDNYPLTKHD